MSRWLALADAAPYRAAGKPVWAVALSFNGRTRQFKGGLRTSSRLETVGGMWYHIGVFGKGKLSP